MINQNFDILAAILALAGAVNYAFTTFRGRAQPNRVSWLLWTITPSITFAAELAQHIHLEVALLTLSEALGPFFVVVASFANRQAFWKVTKFDLGCGAVSILALALWLITGQGDIAIIFSLIASLFSAIPTISKSYTHPRSESPWDYLASMIAGFVTILTIQHWTLANYGFPVYITVKSLLLSFLVLTPQRVKDKLVTAPAPVRPPQNTGVILPTVTTPVVVTSVSTPAGLTASSPTRIPTLSWTVVPEASSYKVYRDGIAIGTSKTSTFTDTSATDSLHAYYVTAVNGQSESSASNTVSVLVDQTPPIMTYSLSLPPNENGWHNQPVTVTFLAEDLKAGVSSCSPPVLLNHDGINQTVTGWAMNYAGDSSSIAAVVSIDQTPPTFGRPSWSANPVKANTVTTLTVPVIDNTSGVVQGEYIGSIDPGRGNGTPMVLGDGSLSVALTAAVPPGPYPIYIRAKDAAGNWSELLSTTLTVA